MATSLPWHPLLPSDSQRLRHTNKHLVSSRHLVGIQAFRRSDFDGFASGIASGEVWRNAWRSANNGFELLVYETKKTAERIDRRYSVSRRLSAVADSAAYRARELDRDLEITQRWRTFTLDFSRDWPKDAAQKLFEYSSRKKFCYDLLPVVCTIRVVISDCNICNMCAAICWSSSHWGCC